MTASLLVLAAVLTAPWHVGPAPSAHAVQPGVGVELTGVAYVGGATDEVGGRLDLGWAPHPRVWVEVSAQPWAGWTVCPDCRAPAAALTARGAVLQTECFAASVWMVATTSPLVIDWVPGASIEGGTRRLRFDTAWPIWSTFDLLTTLRIVPELGVSYAWTDAHHTRLAVVGLEPSAAALHRWRVSPSWQLQGVLRRGEEGWGFELGVRWSP